VTSLEGTAVGNRVAVDTSGVLFRIGNAISSISSAVAGVALLAIVSINGANVAGRYFLSRPISWAEESMLYLMILVVFSAVAGVTWKGSHIKIELLLEFMPRHLRRVAAWVSSILTIGVCLVVAASSLDVVSQLYAFDQRSDALEFPVWIAQSAVLVGLVLVAFTTVLRLLVFGATTGEHS
jgi:TRAP-type C4-dicarboxylate transport system permease small subunit